MDRDKLRNVIRKLSSSVSGLVTLQLPSLCAASVLFPIAKGGAIGWHLWHYTQALQKKGPMRSMSLMQTAFFSVRLKDKRFVQLP